MKCRRPIGRPKKTWSKIVEEDTRKLNITEDMAKGINSGCNSYQVQPRIGKLETLNKDDDNESN